MTNKIDTAKLREKYLPFEGPDHAQGLGALNHYSFLGEQATKDVRALCDLVERQAAEIERLRTALIEISNEPVNDANARRVIRSVCRAALNGGDNAG